MDEPRPLEIMEPEPPPSPPAPNIPLLRAGATAYQGRRSFGGPLHSAFQQRTTLGDRHERPDSLRRDLSSLDQALSRILRQQAQRQLAKLLLVTFTGRYLLGGLPHN